MADLNQADFYFGAVLSQLLSKRLKLALIESGKDKRTFDISTDNSSFQLFIWYRSTSDSVRENESIWNFTFNDTDINTFRNLERGMRLVLVLGHKQFNKSRIVCLNGDEIRKVIVESSKKSIGVKYKKFKRDYFITRGGGKLNDLPIKASNWDLIESLDPV